MPDPSASSNQSIEQALRERVAAGAGGDYLRTIARNHSMPVMDGELDRFLGSLPSGASILDIGGCWGWHWRRLRTTRPDVRVTIIDFVHANLTHARNVLGPLVDDQVFLVHADATALPFPAAAFDGVWTVQTLQHIPDFNRACTEASRVLSPGGRFVNYSLHITPMNQVIYRLLNRRFHVDGAVPGAFHLTRANDQQRQVVAGLFSDVTERFTECSFHPDLRFTRSGRSGDPLGRLDARLGDLAWLGRLIARQRSWHGIKA